MTAVLRWTGLGKLVSFYRHIYFAGPRTTTGSGILLVLGVGAIHLYLLLTNSALAPSVDSPAYLDAYFASLLATAVLAAVGMVTGRKPAWALGSLVSAAAMLMYIASRMWGLPGLPSLVGYWDYPLGTFVLALAAPFLALHFAVVTGLCVAFPERRDWPGMHSELVARGGGRRGGRT